MGDAFCLIRLQGLLGRTDVQFSCFYSRLLWSRITVFFYSVLWSRLLSDGCGNDCEEGENYFFSFLYFYEINVHLYFLLSYTFSWNLKLTKHKSSFFFFLPFVQLKLVFICGGTWRFYGDFTAPQYLSERNLSIGHKEKKQKWEFPQSPKFSPPFLS